MRASTPVRRSNRLLAGVAIAGCAALGGLLSVPLAASAAPSVAASSTVSARSTAAETPETSPLSSVLPPNIHTVGLPRNEFNPSPGSRWLATTGSWSVLNSHLTFTYQWTANGRTIKGATHNTFTLTTGLVGKRIGATVTAHHGSETASRASRGVSEKWPSRTSVAIAESRIGVGERAHVTVTVHGRGRATGSVYLHYGSHVVRVVLHAADRNVARFTLPTLPSGHYSVWASYRGGPTVLATDTSMNPHTLAVG